MWFKNLIVYRLPADWSVSASELEDMLAKEGKAEVTCTFCSTVYQVSADELRAMLEQPKA